MNCFFKCDTDQKIYLLQAKENILFLFDNEYEYITDFHLAKQNKISSICAKQYHHEYILITITIENIVHMYKLIHPMAKRINRLHNTVYIETNWSSNEYQSYIEIMKVNGN